MPGILPDLVDNSPRQPAKAAPVPTASNLVLIDNYDSFTWNVYQYLMLEGASVKVFRNDEISLEHLITLKPTQLVISPGPGHPRSDAGISEDAIRHFAGKVPILGVCMGEQCVYTVFGGTVDVTGEILHGKTSKLQHDGKGIYSGLGQAPNVTRYHSLAGTHGTLPDSLEVSSWVEKQDMNGPDGAVRSIGNSVIMGVRHKEFTVEGCQYHPESILTEWGREMLRNFLHLQGGTWKESRELAKQNGATGLSNGVPTSVSNGASTTSKPSTSQDKPVSILEKIFAHRRDAVAQQKLIPSLRPSDLQSAYELNLAPPQISFPARLRQFDYTLSLMAEVKRASPSKGLIAMDACAPAQAREYALAGASVISVLTEPEWFKGSIEDLRFVRQSLEGMRNRPAVLRKEFVFDEYQILEARLAGADTILLIVKMLDEATLTKLYKYSQSLGMEPLVEVNTPEEMKAAAALGAQVIGVNNRNLATFDVDLETTSRLMDAAPKGSIVCALSGISGPQDVAPYQKNGVGAVLVGEALMRASDTVKFVTELLGGSAVSRNQQEGRAPLVKICGTRTPEAAKTAIEAGADLIGMIMVEGRTRFVPHDVAKQISEVVHRTPKVGSSSTNEPFKDSASAQDYFKYTSQNQLKRADRALIVGVFRNQPLSYILERQKALDLDMVQLHGSEPIEWANLIPVPCSHVFKPGDNGIGKRGYHAISLLDAGSGGSGQTLNTDQVAATLQKDEQLHILFAGGLTPDNVAQQVEKLGKAKAQVLGVDVSSGVETDEKQDLEKIKAFVKAAKQINLGSI